MTSDQQRHDLGQHVDRLANQSQRPHRPDGPHRRTPGPQQRGRNAAEQQGSDHDHQGNSQQREPGNIPSHVLDDLQLQGGSSCDPCPKIRGLCLVGQHLPQSAQNSLELGHTLQTGIELHYYRRGLLVVGEEVSDQKWMRIGLLAGTFDPFDGGDHGGQQRQQVTADPAPASADPHRKDGLDAFDAAGTLGDPAHHVESGGS